MNREPLNKIKIVQPNCGFFCLLSDEKLEQNKNEIISPIKEHSVSLTEIFDRAKKNQERENIALATKAQSNCIVKHGLNTDLFVLQPLRAREH